MSERRSRSPRSRWRQRPATPRRRKNVIAATALSLTTASAHGWHHWNHWHGHYWGGRYYPVYYGGLDRYVTRQVCCSYSGKHVRLVRACD